MKTLFVTAHPDDEVLGCGGTIPRLVSEGHEVYIAILGEGITSRYSQRDDADKSLVDSLHKVSNKVSELLGASGLFMYSLPDNRFDTIPLLDIVKIVEDLITKIEPEAIYTHHGGDLNIDHSLIFRAVLTATRLTEDCTVRSVYAFEVPSSTEWAFDKLQPPFHPNYFVNISDQIDTKIEAMSLYDQEMRPFPHPRSEEALRANATRWGSAVGVRSAEAFELIRCVVK